MALRVGEPYDPNRSTWPVGASYSASEGRHALFLSVALPSDAVVEAVATGRVRFGLTRPPEAPFFYVAYAFGEEPWRLVPVSWHRLPPDERAVPPPKDDGDAPLVVVLVDAETGIVRALRAVLLAGSVVARLHGALRQQAARPWIGEDAFQVALADAGRRYTPDELVTRWAMVTQGAGLPSDGYTAAEIRRRAVGRSAG